MKQYCFVLIPSFSMLSFSCALDTLRSANFIIGHQYYCWQTVTPIGESIVSSSAVTLQTENIDAITTPDVIAVCGGDRSHFFKSSNLTRVLNEQAKRGCKIGSFTDGAFVVAETGLFDKTPSTIHWRCYDAYRERFPDLDIKPSIMEISKNRFSCAGGTSSLDLMLQFIRDDHGADVVAQIANNYYHDTIRDGTREQHATNSFRAASRNPVLGNALLLMEANLENPLAIKSIAKRLGISQRQLDRIFNEHIGVSPHIHYRELRLTRAWGLLLQTGMSVSEIAVGCGFQSASHLAKYFTARFGATPGQYRKQNVIN